jgi:hypothetical protein
MGSRTARTPGPRPDRRPRGGGGGAVVGAARPPAGTDRLGPRTDGGSAVDTTDNSSSRSRALDLVSSPDPPRRSITFHPLRGPAGRPTHRPTPRGALHTRLFITCTARQPETQPRNISITTSTLSIEDNDAMQTWPWPWATLEPRPPSTIKFRRDSSRLTRKLISRLALMPPPPSLRMRPGARPDQH